jgi:hypothetical protein
MAAFRISTLAEQTNERGKYVEIDYFGNYAQQDRRPTEQRSTEMEACRPQRSAALLEGLGKLLIKK